MFPNDIIWLLQTQNTPIWPRKGAECELYGTTYRALVVQPDAYDERRQEKVDKQIVKEQEDLTKRKKGLEKIYCACLPDAEAAMKRVSPAQFHQFTVAIEPRPQYHKGKPKTDGTRRLKSMKYGLKPGFAHAFVGKDASADTIEGLLKRPALPIEENKPLIASIRSDGWSSCRAVPKKLGVVLYRAVPRDPKDSMKLLPWTHRLIADAKGVVSGPHRGGSEKPLQLYLSGYDSGSAVAFDPMDPFTSYLRPAAPRALSLVTN